MSSLKLENNSNVSSQESLVKLLLKKDIKPIEHVIPAGQTMLDTLDEPGLLRAINTWLKRTREFTDFEISFCKDKSAFKSTTRKAREYSTRNPIPPWEQDQGKGVVARQIHEILSKANNTLSIKVTKEGIFLTTAEGTSFKQGDEQWYPHLVITPIRSGTYRETS